MQLELPRLLIGGTQSGCGKTTVTSAILQAFVDRGQTPAAFKCGPDYIDPMFHTEVIGAPSRNLDLFLCTPDTVRALLAKNGAGAPLAVIEGVMGYYDGVGGTTTQASACDLAVQTETPSVLVLSVKGMSLSAAAVLRGFAEFAPNTVRGVILNGVSEGMYAYYRDIIEQNTGLHVYGHLPHCPEAEIGSRHLGLITAGEIADLKERLHRLAALAARTIDLDGLLALARSAPVLPYTPFAPQPICTPPVRIGLARDRAFCFYYADSLDLLRALGAELIEFSPLHDPALPDGLHGLYLGGGYPELAREALGANRTMCDSIARAVRGSLPTIAECGGFMYLQQRIEEQPMVGVLPGAAHLEKRLQNFGYVTLTAQRDTLLCRTGQSIRAHEFHYSVSDDAGDAFRASKPLRAREWSCIHATDTVFAGYPHLHLCANPDFAINFVRRCDAYRKGK